MKKVQQIFQSGVRTLNVLGLVTLLLISSLVIISPLVRADDEFPSVTISASPDDICPGGSSVLNWNSVNATSVSIDNGVGSVDLSGSTRVYPTVSTTYTITATNSTGSTTGSAQVIVLDNCGGGEEEVEFPSVTISASPDDICPGGSSVLNWNSVNATSLSINNGVGNVNASGTRSVSPSSTTTYTITATNSRGSTTATAEVIVLNNCGGGPGPGPTNTAPTLTLTGGDMTLCVGATFTDPGATATDSQDGNITSRIQKTGSVNTGVAGTYTLYYNVTDLGGLSAPQVTRTVTVNTCGGGGPILPTVTINASPSSICPGQSTTLNWSSSNATSISIDNGVGAVATSGSRVVSPSSTTTYRITGTGSGTTATSSTIVTVSTSCGGGGGPLPPTVTTNSCTAITGTSATLNGIADGNGYSIAAFFEWGTDSANLSNVTTQNQYGGGVSDFSYNISNLIPGQTYYYRAIARSNTSRVMCNVLSCTMPGGGGPIIPPPVSPTATVTGSTRVATARTATTRPTISLAQANINTIQCFAVTNGNLPRSVNLSPSTNVSPAPATLSANAFKSGVLFLPMSLFGWMILIILVLVLTILAQHLFAQMSTNRNVVVEQAHHYY